MADNNTIGLQAIVDVTQFNQGLRLYIKGMLDMTNATTQASTQINRLGTVASVGLGTALGSVAVSAAQSLMGVLSGMAQQVGENISQFQSLGLALNYFTARALQEDTDMPLAQALRETTTEAQGLLLWVERLATLSPFTSEAVGNALRTAQAYGLSLAAAQKLVPLLVDFAAVNNLSAELLQRVALAISQIQARGKLASQEINQLANAGLPIRSLLAKALNVTSGELEKMLEEGLIPAGTAIQAVTDYLEGFGGAAEQVTRGTLKGIISSLQDIRDISSRDLFGPMISSFFPLLNQLVDLGTSTQFKAGVKVIGQELGEGLAVRIRLAVSQVGILVQSLQSIPAPVLQATAIFVGFTVVLAAFTGAVGLLAAALFVLINPFTLIIGTIAAFVTAYSVNFRGLREITEKTTQAVSTAMATMGRTIASVISSVVSILSTSTSAIGEFATAVVQYGANVVDAFVTGIMGAMGLLVDAMQFIGQILQFWLAPGSPPRVAPELDTWGKDSANEWLKGWLSADFDILSGISKDIGNVLGALVSAGKLDELSAPRILRALRTELAAAVGEFRSFGKVSEDTLRKVASSAGPAANEVKALFKVYVALAAENEAVRASQERLNEITEKYDAILTPLRKKLSDISELRQQADEQKEILSLTRLINNAGVSTARKQAAQLRIQEIMTQRQVRGIENQQDAEETLAEKELKAAQKRRDQAEENLSRVKAMIEVQNEQLGLYGEELQILEKIRKEQERLAKEARQKMLEQLKKQLEIAQLLQAELRDAVGVFKAQHTLADDTATAAEKAAAALELQAILGRRIVRNFEAMELGVDPSEIQAIRDTLITLEDIGIKSKGDLGSFEFGADSALEDVNRLVKEMNDAMQDIRKMFSDTRAEVDGFLTSINDMLPGFLKFRKAVSSSDISVSDHVRSISAATEGFNDWPPLFKTLSTAFAGLGAGLATSRLLTVVPKLIVGLGGPIGIITTLVSVFAAAWAGDWYNIRQVTADAISYVQGLITNFLDAKPWEKYVTAVGNSIQYAQDALMGFASVFKDTFLYVIRPILAQGLSFKSIEQSVNRLRTVVIEALNRLSGDVSTEAAAVAVKITSAVQTFLTSQWTPFIALLAVNARTIVNVFSTVFQEIVKQFGFLPRLISFAVRTILTLFTTGLRGLAPIVAFALAPINKLILASLGGLGHLIAAVIVSPFKLLGNLVNLNQIIGALVNQFTTGFAAQVAKAAPKLFVSLLTGLVQTGVGLGKIISGILNTSLKIPGAIAKGQVAIFNTLNGLAFNVYAAFTNLSIFIPKALGAMGTAFQIFGGIATKVLLFVSDAVLSLVAIDYKPFFDFFNRIKPTATATMPILIELFELTVAAFGRLKIAAFEAAVAFTQRLLPVFFSGGNAATGFLGTITKIGAAIGGKFVTVFQQFKGVGPTVAAAFQGIASGLKNLSLVGSIKILEFFDGLSKGILSFAGAGQAKLGNALAGIFQGAFKGITGGITGAPNFIGSFLKNLKLGALGQAAKIKGPVVLGQFFSTLSSFKPANIVKGMLSIFSSVKKVSAAFGGFLNPLNLVLGAIDFFGFAFKNNIDGVENRAVGFVDSLKAAWASLIDGSLWQSIVDNATSAFNFISDVWAEFQTNGINSPKLREMLTTAGTTILTWITTTGSSMLTGIRDFWLPIFGQWIVESVQNLGTQLGQLLIFLRDFIVNAGMWLGGVIAASWTFFWTWWNDQGGSEKTMEWLTGVYDLVSGWIVTSATFLYDNFIKNWLPAFVEWLTKGGGIDMMLTKLIEFIGFIGKWLIETALPFLVDKFLMLATVFVSWLGPALGWLIENLGNLLAAIIRWIIGTAVPGIVAGVIYLVQALVGWISGGEGSATAEAPTRLGEFLKAISDFFTVHILPALLAAGKAIVVDGIWAGFVDMWAVIMQTGPAQAVADFLAEFAKGVTDLYNAGLAFAKTLIDGITAGFTTYVTEPYDAFKTWLQNLVGGGAEEVEAHSPSELTKRLIGLPLAQGIEEGIRSLTDSDVFKTVRNLAVKGLSAFREDGTEEVDDFGSGALKIVDDLYTFIVNSTTTFAQLLTASYTTFLTAIKTLLSDFALFSLTLWDGVRSDAILMMTNMSTSIITNLGTFALNVQTAMTAIKNSIVGAFTLANTEATTEVKKLASTILGVLVGKGEADQTSVVFQIKEAMNAAGKLVAKAFVDGLIFVFTDDVMLTPLWTAIDTLVNGIILKFQSSLAVGSPSKLAADAVGKPIAEGIGVGMMNAMPGVGNSMASQLANMLSGNGVFSQFASKPGTFMPSNVTNVSRNQEMNLVVNSTATSQGIISDFAVMRTMMRE